MRAEGFEYISTTLSGINPNDPFFAAYSLADRDIAKAWGFGISTLFFPQSVVGPDLLGTDIEAANQWEEDNRQANPNTKIFEAMDEATSAAYQQTYFGSDNDPGCLDQAQAEVGVGQPNTAEQEGVDELWSAVFADSRVIDWQTTVLACLAAEGYEVAFDEGWHTINFIGIFEQLQPLEEVFLEENPESRDDYLIRNELAPGVELSPAAKTTLAEIQSDEIKMALAAMDCGVGEPEKDEFFGPIIAEYAKRSTGS